jgi:hypothetical protein
VTVPIADHGCSHPREMLGSIRPALKPRGRLVLVEYRGEDPTPPIALPHRMTVSGSRREIGAEGFVFVEVAEDLPRQHVMMFRRE